MLRLLNPLMQRLRRVRVFHHHRLLGDDRPGIHSRIHKVHGATGDLHSVIERLFPCLQPGK